MAGHGKDDITVGILVASDSFFGGKENDGKGEHLKDMIDWRQHINGSVVTIETVPDDQEQIKAKLILWTDYLKLDLILTSGGTGFSARDVTPEATRAVLDKEAPGMALAMLQGSLKITPMAMLSRPVCGIRGKTLILNLPGSPKGAAECFLMVCPGIPHAVDLLKEHKREVKETHSTLLAEGIKHPQHSSHHHSHMRVNQYSSNGGLSQGIQGSVTQLKTESTSTQGGAHSFWTKHITRKKLRFDQGSVPPRNTGKTPVKTYIIVDDDNKKSGGTEITEKLDQQDKHQTSIDSFEAETLCGRYINYKSPQRLQRSNANSLHVNPLGKTTENCDKQSSRSPSASQIQHKDIQNSPQRISSSHMQVTGSTCWQRQCGNGLPLPQESQSHLIKRAKIYKCNQGGETAYPAVGTALRTFLAQHPLIQGIQLYKGKRQIKKKFVQLCQYGSNTNQLHSDKSSCAINTLTSGHCRDIDNTAVYKAEATQTAGNSQLPTPCDPSSRNLVSTESNTKCRASPEKWQRGKDLLERNSLKDTFMLTSEGHLALGEVTAGQARDQYVVNWYMWCPGRTNCRRKCGGYGTCVKGCHGMQHKQDRHNCCVMVNLKLFLTDTHHWRVHITGSHIPQDAGLQWIPPSRSPTTSSAVIASEYSRKTMRKSDQVPLPGKLSIPNLNTHTMTGSNCGSFEEFKFGENHSNKVTWGLGSTKFKTNENFHLNEEMMQTPTKTLSNSEVTQIPKSFPDKIAGLIPREAVQDKNESALHLSSSFNLDSSKIHTQSYTNSANSLGSFLGSSSCDVKTTAEQNRSMNSEADVEISSKQSASVMSNIDSQTFETPLANVIPSKKRISKMLSKLKHHRMKRRSLMKNLSSRRALKSEMKETCFRASESPLGTNAHFKKLDTGCLKFSSSNEKLDQSTNDIQVVTDRPLYNCNAKHSSTSFSQNVDDIFLTSAPQNRMQTHRSAPFQLNDDLSTNLALVGEVQGKTIISKDCDGGGNWFSVSNTFGSQKTFSNSLVTGNFIGDSSTAFVSDSVRTSVMTSAGQLGTGPSLHSSDDHRPCTSMMDSQNLHHSISDNCFSNKSSSVFTQVPQIQRQEPCFAIPLCQPDPDNSQYKYIPSEETPKFFTRDLRNGSPQPQSLSSSAFDLQQLRLGCSEPKTVAGHTYSDSFNVLATPLHQVSYGNNPYWSGTAEETVHYSGAAQMGDFQDNSEPNQNLETLPSYQEAATFLAAQFDFLNPS